MKPFDYTAVQSVDEVTALLGAHPGALLLAGGTDLIVQLRAGRKTADLVVDIKHIPELNEIRYDPAQGLRLGAAVPVTESAPTAPSATLTPRSPM